MMTLAPAFTPLHIDIMLHAYARADAMSNWNAPATQQYAAELVELGLIEVLSFDGRGQRYKWCATPRGKAWITMLLATPLPEQSWSDPRRAT